MNSPDAIVLDRGDGWLLLWLDGQRVRVDVADDGPATWVSIGGRARRVSPLRPAAQGTASGGLVTPATPATLVKVLVAVGDAVAAGDPLAVVSAMKMETTLVSPRAGVVSEVNASAGDAVSPGDQIVVLEETCDE